MLKMLNGREGSYYIPPLSPSRGLDGLGISHSRNRYCYIHMYIHMYADRNVKFDLEKKRRYQKVSIARAAEREGTRKRCAMRRVIYFKVAQVDQMDEVSRLEETILEDGRGGFSRNGLRITSAVGPYDRRFRWRVPTGSEPERYPRRRFDIRRREDARRG